MPFLNQPNLQSVALGSNHVHVVPLLEVPGVSASLCIVSTEHYASC